MIYTKQPFEFQGAVFFASLALHFISDDQVLLSLHFGQVPPSCIVFRATKSGLKNKQHEQDARLPTWRARASGVNSSLVTHIQKS